MAFSRRSLLDVSSVGGEEEREKWRETTSASKGRRASERASYHWEHQATICNLGDNASERASERDCGLNFRTTFPPLLPAAAAAAAAARRKLRL